MRNLGFLLGLITWGLCGVRSQAEAASDPLLVVVEVAPNGDLTPADIRAAIRDELRASVLSPRDPKASAAERLLLINVDDAAIQATLRSGGSQVVSRTLRPPSERAARLQTIAWLAGNIARDQVGTIIETSPEPGSLPARRSTEHPPEKAPAPPMASTLDSPVGGRLEPPPFEQSASHPAAPETLSTGPSGRGGDGNAEWMLAATGGPVVATFGQSSFSSAVTGRIGSIYEVRVEHARAGEAVHFGGAFQIGNLVDGPSSASAGRTLVGVAGLGGSRWGRGRLFLEGTLGLGIALVSLPSEIPTTTLSSTTGFMESAVLTLQYRPVLSATGRVGVGVAATHSFDLLAELDAVVGSAGWEADYLSTTLGLRVHLP